MDERAVVERLFSPEARRDPGALLAASGLETCRHAVVRDALADPGLVPPPITGEAALWRLLARWLISLHGERHRRMRDRFAGLFGPRRAPAYRAAITERVDALLGALEPRGRMDLARDFARPLPFSVLADVLGVPEADRDLLGERMTRIGQGFARQREPEFVERGSQAAAEVLAYVEDLLRERAASPRDDLLSVLAADPPADEEEHADLVANCVFLIEAGHATTTSLIAAGTLLLLEHPDQLEGLRSGRIPIAGAVEELLRLIAPVTGTPRCSPGGQARMYFLAGANRDPEVFPDPDRFDAAREPNRHLSFAAGRHFCLGAPLARLHGEIAITALLQRLPGLRVDGPPEWRGAIPLHEIEHLPVAWDTA